MEIIFVSILLGLLYALNALGFTVLFGVSGIVNFAHGSLMVVAAFTSWAITRSFGSSLLVVSVSVIVAIVVVHSLSTIIKHVGIRPIQSRRTLTHLKREGLILASTLLAAVIINEGIRLLFGSEAIITALAIPGVVTVWGVDLLLSRLLIGMLSLGLLCATALFFIKARTGLALRAVAQSPIGVEISGVDKRRLEAFVWWFYSIMTALAGVLTGSFVGVSPHSGISFTITAFAVVVLGGLGSIVGSFVAAFILAASETIVVYLFLPQYSGIPALLFMILILLVRPNGLFGHSRRAY